MTTISHAGGETYCTRITAPSQSEESDRNVGLDGRRAADTLHPAEWSGAEFT
jgi:hypothetical protein